MEEVGEDCVGTDGRYGTRDGIPFKYDYGESTPQFSNAGERVGMCCPRGNLWIHRGDTLKQTWWKQIYM